MELTVSQAAYLVRRNERAVRWHIGKGHLTPTAGDDGHARLDLDAVASVRGWRVDPARLAELHAEERQTTQAMDERLRDLERRVLTLERIVTRLGGSGALGGTQTPIDTPKPPDGAVSAPDSVSRGTAYPAPMRRFVPMKRPSSSMPVDLVGAATFATTHNVPESTMKKGILAGRLPAVTGSWKHDRTFIRYALDGDGRHVFFALWGDRHDFIRCADCPH